MATAFLVDQVRSWVGDTPDDQTVADALEFYDDDANQAALSILRRIRANLIAGSAVKFAVDGDYSEDRTGQLAALAALIATLETATGTGGLPYVTTSLIQRPTSGR